MFKFGAVMVLGNDRLMVTGDPPADNDSRGDDVCDILGTGIMAGG